jgi:cytochrome c554/c'-like protein
MLSSHSRTRTPRSSNSSRVRDRLVVALAAVTLAASSGLAASTIENGQITPSVVCGTCHRDIYQMWRASAHASAMEDVIFVDAYRDMEKHDAATAALCIRCHAPLAQVAGDQELVRQSTWDGVSCDACHGLVSVELAPGGARQVFDIGPVKRGPIRDATSVGHETAYSELHGSALLCAGCHEFQNAEGTPLITTFSEWKESGPGRSGVTCQSCHMGLTRAAVVDPKVKRVPIDRVNLHQMPGGHSLAQLNKALEVDASATRQGDRLALVVRVSNGGAGHAVPTGMPGRRVILGVTVHTSDGQSYEERRVYTKTFRDAHGDPIERDGFVFARGVRLDADTRIRAGEVRTETFSFPVSPGATAYASFRLHYEHAPTGGPENRTWITFYTADRTYLPDGR